MSPTSASPDVVVVASERSAPRVARSPLLPVRTLLAGLALLVGAGWVSAHADLGTATPAPGAVLDAPPEQVVLSFTEPVDTRFSLFKVYPLDAEVDVPEGATALEGTEALRLNGLAGALVADVLTVRGDDDARSDVGLVEPEPRTEHVALALREDLPPGPYVVMWRVLAADTHPTQGFFVFVVTGDGP